MSGTEQLDLHGHGILVLYRGVVSRSFTVLSDNNTCPLRTTTSPHPRGRKLWQSQAPRGACLKTTDAHVRKLMKAMQKHGAIVLAAERSGMDRKTCRRC